MLEFQDLLERLGRQGYSGAPFAYDRRPYGVLAVELDRRDGNPLRLGARLMQEVLTGAATFGKDDLDTILETTQYDTSTRTLIVYWPELKFIPF